MNVNLQAMVLRNSQGSNPLGNGTTLLDILVNSSSVLAVHADTKPIGYPVLIPKNQSDYPGSYEVWYPVEDGWVYVSEDGMVVHSPELPPHWAVREA